MSQRKWVKTALLSTLGTLAFGVVVIMSLAFADFIAHPACWLMGLDFMAYVSVLVIAILDTP